MPTVTSVDSISVAPPLSGTLPAPLISTCPTVDLLGVRFHALSFRDSLQTIQSFIEQRLSHQICLTNAYSLTLAQVDPEFKSVLEKSSLVLADGMSIVWGAHWVDVNLPGRVAGPDLMAGLCDLAAEKGYRVFLLGSTDTNLAQLKRALQMKNPHLQIVDTYAPPFADRLSDEENERIAEKVRRSQADLLFVSMSAPKQEKWIAQNLSALKTPICIGVGAAFDFLSGRIPRAPDFFQQTGLEWLYRLWHEPRRLWKRYLLGNAVYLSLLARQYLRMKMCSPSISS